MKLLKLFFRISPKYTVVKYLGKFYIRKKSLFGYEYLDRSSDYWWTEDCKSYASFNTLEDAIKRWGSSDISDGGTNDIVQVVKILK